MRKSLFVTVAVALVVVACGKVEDEGPTIDASRAIDETDGATVTDAANDAPVAADASVVDAGACMADGGGCSVPPPSTCESATAMATYGDPECLAGKCVWKKTVTPCGIQSQCVAGACTAPTTK